jgi:hypothetical protein
MPIFVNKFIVDFVETAIGAVLALNIFIPGDLSAAGAQASVIGTAVLVALAAAVRRAAPDFVLWFKDQMGNPA